MEEIVLGFHILAIRNAWMLSYLYPFFTSNVEQLVSDYLDVSDSAFERLSAPCLLYSVFYDVIRCSTYVEI